MDTMGRLHERLCAKLDHMSRRQEQLLHDRARLLADVTAMLGHLHAQHSTEIPAWQETGRLHTPARSMRSSRLPPTTKRSRSAQQRAQSRAVPATQKTPLGLHPSAAPHPTLTPPSISSVLPDEDVTPLDHDVATHDTMEESAPHIERILRPAAPVSYHVAIDVETPPTSEHVPAAAQPIIVPLLPDNAPLWSDSGMASPPPLLKTCPTPATTIDTSDTSPVVLNPQERIRQSGMQSYALLAKVGRLLQKGTTTAWHDTEVQQQLHCYGNDLIQYVTTLLTDVEASYRTMAQHERHQMGESLLTLLANIETLCHTLEHAGHTAERQQHEQAHHTVHTLHEQLTTLLGEVTATHRMLVRQPWQRLIFERAGLSIDDYIVPERSPGSDNLTVIHGIGIAIEQRLNQAGICTYAQLAKRSPDHLVPILGNLATVVNTQDWIDQAHQLVEIEAQRARSRPR